MATVSKILAWFRSQIGYKEGKGNANKYSTMMGRPPESWCADFIDAGFKSCGALDLITNSASCTAMYRGMKSLEVSKNNLKPGDIVFFDWDRSGDCDHVGIVEAAGSSQVTTIEGNTSAGNSGSQSNGDGVYRRYRKYAQIAHAVRPKYEKESGGTCEVTLPELKRGSTGNTVRALQTLLRHRFSYNLTIDGDFGPTTEARVKAFQKAHGISQDGIVGKDTWTKLLTA